MLQINFFHLFVTDPNILLILFRMKGGTDFKSGRSFGRPDKFQNGFIVGQRLSRPVIADEGKHAVLDRVPF